MSGMGSAANGRTASYFSLGRAPAGGTEVRSRPASARVSC
ncbi:hypothetical protein E2C01_102437 [Portunus trituberculatus]|uniref:Uncharacterized protein n=1 Tax=Portunus trituberculatus TaxID=210409 RepID=A0A5B7KIG8_PORTR|nr:hypothetical protein [Portunus trituberculatus]